MVCLPRSQRRLFAFLNQPRHGAAISSRARRLASIRTWEYRESMARETWPAMLIITSSPAPDSANSVTSVCRLSCQRPTTFAFSHALIRAVRNSAVCSANPIDEQAKNTAGGRRRLSQRRACEAGEAGTRPLEPIFNERSFTLATRCSIHSTGGTALSPAGLRGASPPSFHTWNSPGTYIVRVMASCITDTGAVSGISGGLAVTIGGESVSTPNAPVGTEGILTNNSYSHSTGGAVSNGRHRVQYKLFRGDGT